MRTFKHIALSTIITLSVFGAVLYTSCAKNGCKGVTCLNGGICSGGICTSCPPGIGGNNCEIIYRKLYAYSYKGSATYNSSVVDSSYIIRTDTGNILMFSYLNDSNYTKMQVTWNRTGGKPTVVMPIILSNNSASGSTFSISTPTTVDTFTYSGSGSVSATTASLNLTESHPHSPSVIVTLSNLIKQ